MKTFLINLDYRDDRLAYVQEQADALGIDFERVSAIDGNLVSAEDKKFFNENKFFLNCKKKAVAGEIGCAISHRNTWQKIIDENIPFALILEDDVSLSPQLTAFLDNKHHYEQFDFLNLSFNHPYRLDQKSLKNIRKSGSHIRPYIWQNRTEWRKLEWRRKWRIFKLFFYDHFVVCEADPAPTLGSGYIVSFHGAKKLLETSENLFVPIDLTWRISDGRLRQGFLVDPLVNQTLDDSNINGREQKIVMTHWQKIKRFFVKTRRWRRRWDLLKMYGWGRL